ncbi:MAG: response regulator [Phycisphaerae bacterium]|nr:response regulator [Phycisphaerae bacterium]
MNNGKPNDKSLFRKAVFTTGEVADICNISQQTVIRCFDNGRLGGFRVPGSRFRRIPRDALIRFMRDNSIPLDRLEVGKKRVLVVDDDPAMIEMLVDLLERYGRFDVQTAQTGFEAGVKTKDFSPDVIVLDYMLPDVNGDAVCRTIRSDHAMDGVRIIMVSGVVDPADVERLKAAGADEFLQKPFSIEQLVNLITGMIRA